MYYYLYCFGYFKIIELTGSFQSEQFAVILYVHPDGKAVRRHNRLRGGRGRGGMRTRMHRAKEPDTLPQYQRVHSQRMDLRWR